MFGRKNNLRKLTDSISKDDFNIFKAAYVKVTKESELAKKLYEKWNGRHIPENILCFIITFGDRDLYRTEDHKDEFISIKMREHYNSDEDYKRTIDTSGIVEFDDDIANALLHYGPRLLYKRLANIKEENVVNEYIESKASRYGIELDNETYHKLRNFVESL